MERITVGTGPLSESQVVAVARHGAGVELSPDSLNAITFGGLLVPGVFTLTLIFAAFGWFYPGRIVRGVTVRTAQGAAQ